MNDGGETTLRMPLSIYVWGYDSGFIKTKPRNISTTVQSEDIYGSFVFGAVTVIDILTASSRLFDTPKAIRLSQRIQPQDHSFGKLVTSAYPHHLYLQ